MHLAVHPQSVFLIIYPGGHCGDFLAWWLSMHPGCVLANHLEVANNRYLCKHSYNYTLDENGTRDKLFLTGHSSTEPSKNGVIVSDPAQHIYLYASERYQRFFKYLYMIKTIFHKYRTNNPQVVFKDKPLEWAEFVKSLNGQPTFIGAVMESWIHSQHSNGIEQWAELFWGKFSRYLRPDPQHKLNYDISQLFFNNINAGCQDFCQQLNVHSSDELESYVLKYHQKNLLLVETHAGMTVDKFLDLPEQRAQDVVIQNIQSLLQETYSLV